MIFLDLIEEEKDDDLRETSNKKLKQKNSVTLTRRNFFNN